VNDRDNVGRGSLAIGARRFDFRVGRFDFGVGRFRIALDRKRIGIGRRHLAAGRGRIGGARFDLTTGRLGVRGDRSRSAADGSPFRSTHFSSSSEVSASNSPGQASS
jgi:hypothetical protein